MVCTVSFALASLYALYALKEAANHFRQRLDADVVNFLVFVFVLIISALMSSTVCRCYFVIRRSAERLHQSRLEKNRFPSDMSEKFGIRLNIRVIYTQMVFQSASFSEK
jgi:hypothetical protein